MKIAAITEDGVTISQHFGRAPYYVVLTVENGEVVKREVRDKLGHAHFVGEEGHLDKAGRHGFGPEAQDRHSWMAAAIADCEVLLCQGMGWGAYESMKQAGITPIVTDIAEIEAAVQAYLDGTIVDHKEFLH
jgi:predicted Fe-Mo cluster-binding NifX family protein